MKPSHRATPIAIALMLGGCLASLPPRVEQATQPILDPTRYFAGHTRGEGTFDFRFSAARNLRVEGSGRTQADSRFRLEQTITCGDSSVETRVWIVTRVDATHFTASLSDAKGEAQAAANGARFHRRYLRRHPVVYMEQWRTLNANGRTVGNQAQVTVFGVPWAQLSETITNFDAPSLVSGFFCLGRGACGVISPGRRIHVTYSMPLGTDAGFSMRRSTRPVC